MVDLISVLQLGWAGGQSQTGMLLSIDLQKAFDSVSWPYLFGLLEDGAFGNKCLTLLGALCVNPVEKVRLQPLSIARGTRQGCPLSPHIFAIMIKTLAFAIRSDPNIHGVDCD